MKLSKLALCLAALLFLSPFTNSQELYDPTGESAVGFKPIVIRVYVEYFEVTTLELAEIMSIPKLGNDDTKLRAELLTKAKEGKVTLLESQTIVSRSGERATTESITEYIYPTEYDISKPKPEEQNEAHSAIVVPTAFEVRNLGATCEVEPILGEDGKTIDMTFKPEICYLVGESTWGQSPKADVTFKMPTIYTLRLNTSFTLTAGKFHFVSALTPKDGSGKADTTKKILVLIRADTLKVGF